MVFSFTKTLSTEPVDALARISGGRLAFKALGPTTENDLEPMFVFILGTSYSAETAERDVGLRECPCSSSAISAWSHHGACMHVGAEIYTVACINAENDVYIYEC